MLHLIFFLIWPIVKAAICDIQLTRFGKKKQMLLNAELVTTRVGSDVTTPSVCVVYWPGRPQSPLPFCPHNHVNKQQIAANNKTTNANDKIGC